MTGMPSAEAGVTDVLAAVAAEDGREAALDRAFRTLAGSGLRVRMMREERENLEEVFLQSISRSVAEEKQ